MNEMFHGEPPDGRQCPWNESVPAPRPMLEEVRRNPFGIPEDFRRAAPHARQPSPHVNRKRPLHRKLTRVGTRSQTPPQAQLTPTRPCDIRSAWPLNRTP